MTANDLGGALQTWRILDPIAPEEMRKQLQPTIDHLITMRDSDKAFALSARIDKGTRWHGSLLRHRFAITVTDGAVSEIKLRCEKQYLFFKYDPSLEYSVNGRSGLCGIEIVGAPGTTFELIQS
jgi:hypothetical protein